MVIALERNLSAGDNVANIRVLKNRFNGQTGPAGSILFNKDTGRMTEDLTSAFDSPSTPSSNDSYSDF
jgi:twinkle protein